MSRPGIGFPSTTDSNGEGRVQVDPGQTSYFEGREFKVSRFISMTAGQTLWFKFTNSVPFEVFTQRADIYGAVDIRIYAPIGTESGTFTAQPWIVGKNLDSRRPKIDDGNYWQTQATVSSGGTFSPTNVESYRNIIRLRSGQATSGKTNVSRESGSELRFDAGTFYLRMVNLDNSATEVTFTMEYSDEP